MVAACHSFDMNSEPTLYLTLTVLLCLAGWLLHRAESRCEMHSRRWWALVFAIGALARIIAFFYVAPSDDVNRYVWEGKIVASGRSPYEAPADDPRWLSDRDLWYQGMNHLSETTVYPPLMQLAGAALVRVRESTVVFKLFALLFDLVICGLLIAYWAKSGRSQGTLAAFWIVNPVPVISFAGEAHFDSAMIFFALAAVTLAQRGRLAFSWAALGTAIAIKWIALVMLPLWLWRTRGRGMWAALPVLIIPALPFYDNLDDLFRALLSFGSSFGSNNPLHYFLTYLSGSRSIASAICALLLAIVSARIILSRDETSWTSANTRLWSALLLFLPTITYWYAAWILPFAATSRRWSWWIYSATAVFYYAAAWQSQTTGVWGHPPWAIVLTWLPLYTALLLSSRTEKSSRPEA